MTLSWQLRCYVYNLLYNSSSSNSNSDNKNRSNGTYQIRQHTLFSNQQVNQQKKRKKNRTCPRPHLYKYTTCSWQLATSCAARNLANPSLNIAASDRSPIATCMQHAGKRDLLSQSLNTCQAISTPLIDDSWQSCISLAHFNSKLPMLKDQHRRLISPK